MLCIFALRYQRKKNRSEVNYYYNPYFSPYDFFTPTSAARLSLDSKSPQESRTLLRILADHYNAMVSCHLIFSNTGNLFSLAFRNHSEYTNYNWYSCHPHVSQFYQWNMRVTVIPIIIIIIILLERFSYQRYMILFQRSLSDSKSPQDSRTLLSILADLKTAVVWMVSIRPQISNSSCRLSEPFQTCELQLESPSSLRFTSLFVLWLGLSTYYFFPFLWSSLCGPLEQQNSLRGKFFCQLSLGLVFWWGFGDLFVTQNARIFFVSFLRTDYGLHIHHLVVWLNFTFWLNSRWIIFPTQSCLDLCSFCASLLHLLIIWLTISSFLPHNQHLLFCCISSNSTLISLVLMALFSAAIRRDWVSLLRFPFRNYAQVFSCEISLVCHLKYPYSCFPSRFFFLVIIVLFIFMLSMQFLVAVISLSLLFLCSPRVLVLIHLQRIQCNCVLLLFLFLTHWVCLCHLLDVRPCAETSISLSLGPYEFLPGLFWYWSRVSYRRNSSDFYLFDEISAADFGLENLSRSSEAFFSFFFFFFISACLMVSASSIPKCL